MRSRRRWRAASLASAALCVASMTSGADWPQYRGPGRDGKSAETGLIRTWGAEGPRELWRISIGAGFSGVSVVSDRLYTMDADEETEYALCLDAGSGASIIDEADLHGALFGHERKGHQLRLEGEGDADGTPAWVLEVTLASGAVQKWFLDQETFLVVRKEVVSEKTEGDPPYADYERPRSWFYDDYRPVAGVMLPFWVYVEEPLFNREYIYDTIEANVRIDEGLFAPPPGSYQGAP